MAFLNLFYPSLLHWMTYVSFNKFQEYFILKLGIDTSVDFQKNSKY